MRSGKQHHEMLLSPVTMGVEDSIESTSSAWDDLAALALNDLPPTASTVQPLPSSAANNGANTSVKVLKSLGQMPDEMLLSIFKWVGKRALKSLRLTCKRFRDTAGEKLYENFFFALSDEKHVDKLMTNIQIVKNTKNMTWNGNRATANRLVISEYQMFSILEHAPKVNTLQISWRYHESTSLLELFRSSAALLASRLNHPTLRTLAIGFEIDISLLGNILQLPSLRNVECVLSQGTLPVAPSATALGLLGPKSKVTTLKLSAARDIGSISVAHIIDSVATLRHFEYRCWRRPNTVELDSSSWAPVAKALGSHTYTLEVLQFQSHSRYPIPTLGSLKALRMLKDIELNCSTLIESPFDEHDLVEALPAGVEVLKIFISPTEYNAHQHYQALMAVVETMSLRHLTVHHRPDTRRLYKQLQMSSIMSAARDAGIKFNLRECDDENGDPVRCRIAWYGDCARENPCAPLIVV